MSVKYAGLAALLIGLALAACNSHTERPPKQDELIYRGQQIYLEFCAECHQVDGTGYSTLFPRLAGNPVVTASDPEPIIMTVTYGQGSMMPFREKLTADDRAAVLSYIRNAWGNQAVPVSPRQLH